MFDWKPSFCVEKNGFKEIYSVQIYSYSVSYFNFCSRQKLYKKSDNSHMAVIKCSNDIQRNMSLYCNKCNISPYKLDSLLSIEVICNYFLVWCRINLSIAALRISLNQLIYLVLFYVQQINFCVTVCVGASTEKGSWVL